MPMLRRIGRQPPRSGLVDVDLAGGRDLEPGQHHQRGGLPGAGWTQQGHELAGRDVERDAVDRDHRAVSLLDLVEDDARAKFADRRLRRPRFPGRCLSHAGIPPRARRVGRGRPLVPVINEAIRG